MEYSIYLFIWTIFINYHLVNLRQFTGFFNHLLLILFCDNKDLLFSIGTFGLTVRQGFVVWDRQVYLDLWLYIVWNDRYDISLVDWSLLGSVK